MAKYKNTDYDDLDDELSGVTNTSKSESESILEQFSTYKNLDVDASNEEILKEATKIIDGLAVIYLNDKITDDDYLGALKTNEINTLVSMTKQIKYADHLVDTLMRRLDNGGYVDSGVFSEIRLLQKHLLQVTKEVSSYTRNLPEFFKFIESDVKSEQDHIDTSEMHSNFVEAKIINTIESNHKSDDLLDFMSTPQRGTRELMLTINDSLTDIDAKLLETAELELDFDPNEINMDDEFDSKMNDLENEDDED